MLAGALVLVSCSGSSVTLEDYLTEANALCADAVERTDAVIAAVFASYPPTIGEEPTDEELMGLYALFVDLESDLGGTPQQMVSDLLALDRPSEAEDLVSHFQAIGQRFEDEWSLLVAASESAEAARTQLARGAPFEDLNARSVELGVSDCVFN